MSLPGTTWPRLFIMTLLFLSLNACRKIDVHNHRGVNTVKEQRFFDHSSTIKPQTARVINEFRTRNLQNELVSKFISQYGYPLWDKTTPIEKRGRTNARGNGGPDTVLIIPVIQPDVKEVQTYIEAHLSDTVQLYVYTSSGYTNLPFGLTDTLVNSAEGLAVRFMQLNKEVFNHTRFRILDKRLFHRSTNYSDTANIQRKVTIRQSDVNTNTRYVTLCVDIVTTTTNYHCTTTGPCASGTCDNCYLCISTTSTVNTICESWWEDDDGYGGPTTGGDGSGGGSGGPGSGSEDGPCNGRGGGSINGRTLPCDTLHDDGWEPIPSDEDEYDPYVADNVIIDTSISNNYPCLVRILDTLADYGNLNRQAQLALSQIFGVNKRIHTTIKLDRSLVGTGIWAQTKKTGLEPTDASDTAQFHFSPTIYINPDILIQGTKEYIITTLTHEAMHAYINYVIMLYNKGLIPSPDYIKALFPIFWTPPMNPTELQQHTLMALKWSHQISASLSPFTNNEIDPAVKDSVYRAIGWGGLHTTDIFKMRADKCDIYAICSVAENKNINYSFTVNEYPGCTTNYTISAQNLNLKNLCE